MSIISKKASSSINSVRLLLVFSIVCLHSRIDQDINPGDAQFFIKYLCNFDLNQDFICHIFHPTIPILFIISGYLFFANINELNLSEYKNKLKSRIKSLLVPYLFWVIISILAGIFIHKQQITISYILESFTTSPGGALWYIRDLIVLAICSPLYYLIAKKIKIGGCILLYIINQAIGSYVLFLNEYFLLGAVLAINKITIEDILKFIDYRLCLVFFVLYKVFTLYYLIEIDIPFLPVFILIGLLGIFYNSNLSFKDSSFSTFLYFSHPYTKMIKAAIVMIIPLNSNINCTIVLITRIMLTIVLSYILYIITPKKIRSILIGGR
ncbi:MAG: acyltransferase family protein [Clostridia bacterium]|nr:acyltransferase family protein [Clostridia bacterium]